jgi:nicotinamide-nucleotide amidase
VRIEIIAIGTELLRLGKQDGNSAWLTEALARVGLDVHGRIVADDDADRLTEMLRSALRRSDWLLLTGGLGPTDDDRTRDALAAALGVGLERDARCEQQLRQRYAEFGAPFGAEQARQADRPLGADWIHNQHGSAPGILIRRPCGGGLAALPGVPAEMRPMFVESVLPLLDRGHGAPTPSVSIRVVGKSESHVDNTLVDLYSDSRLEVTLLGGTHGVDVYARALDADPLPIREFEREARLRLGEHVLGDSSSTLPESVGLLLQSSGQTVATVESCTGGLIAASLTDVPGASRWFRGSLVAYQNDIKQLLAGVSASSLEREGAVSPGVARALAVAARDRFQADHGIGVTGIAGPGGGSEEKPVGLVHLALADVDEVVCRELRLVGDRVTIRRRAVSAALDLLRRRLLDRG